MRILLYLVFLSLLCACGTSPGGVALTFDDNTVESWYASALEIDFKATFYVSHYHQMSDEQIEMLLDLQNRGHEIALHTYDHVNALDYAQDRGLEAYAKEQVFSALEQMEADGFRIRHFAYPFGVGSKATDAILLSRLRSVRYTYYKPIESEASPVFVSRGRLPARITAKGVDERYRWSDEDLLKAIEIAEVSGKVLLLYGHSILDSTDKGTLKSRIRTIRQALDERGMRFYTLSEIGQ